MIQKSFVLKSLLSILGVPTFLILLIFLLQWDGFFSIRKVKVAQIRDRDTPSWLRPHWLEQVKFMNNLKGRDLLFLDLELLAHEIRAKPWVKDVRLSRTWPNEIEVQIAAKELVAYARNEKGNLFPLLDDGTKLAREDFETKMNLPVLTSELSQDLREQIVKAIDLYKAIPSEGVFSRDRISEIGHDPKEGFWTIIAPFGTRVKWGEEDFPSKISRVQQVIDYLDSRHIQARVIDANLAKKVVVRLRKTP